MAKKNDRQAKRGIQAGKTDRKRDGISVYPLYLYLPCLYSNISGLTLFLNPYDTTHTFSSSIMAYFSQCLQAV